MRRQVCTVMASKRCWAVRTNEAKNGDVCLFLVMDRAHECRVLEPSKWAYQRHVKHMAFLHFLP